MAEMAIGYGSEYQLLRYLGHHRNYFYEEIKKVTKSSSTIDWFDYPVALERLSRDGELKGVECFNKLNNEEIKNNWKKFWPTTGNSHNWDGIFIQDDTWYFVEAKANLEEAKQRCHAGTSSRDKIKKAFTTVTKNEDISQLWIDSDYYQLANRLAFISFCKSVGIKAKLLYISFINGYDVNPRKNVSNVKKWEECWNNEYAGLKLDGELEHLKEMVLHLYIDCHEPK